MKNQHVQTIKPISCSPLGCINTKKKKASFILLEELPKREQRLKFSRFGCDYGNINPFNYKESTSSFLFFFLCSKVSSSESVRFGRRPAPQKEAWHQWPPRNADSLPPSGPEIPWMRPVGPADATAVQTNAVF